MGETGMHRVQGASLILKRSGRQVRAVGVLEGGPSTSKSQRKSAVLKPMAHPFDAAPPPPPSCPFVDGMTGSCPYRMTKSNGSCKTGTIARCVQCSGCDYYKVDDANEQASRSSREYLENNPHCARCRKLGKRTAIRKETDFSGPLWSCLQKPLVPAECLSFAKCDAFNYDANERRKCEKFYNAK